MRISPELESKMLTGNSMNGKKDTHCPTCYDAFINDAHQCLSQDLEIGCLKLAGVNILAIQILRGIPIMANILIFQP